MKIKIHQFLSGNHSWSIVGQNIARALINQNHEVHLKSTNGMEHFPEDLKPYIKEKLDNSYDMCLSYTAMKNFPNLLQNGDKKYGVWNYESTILPSGFAKYYKFTDQMLPSSSFAKKVFQDNGVPETHLTVVPHGINVGEYSSKEVYPTKSQKKRKILANIAQPHIRKNIGGLFESFGRAFTKDDDVCLACKVHVKKIQRDTLRVRHHRAARKLNNKRQAADQKKDRKDQVMAFDVDFWKHYNEFIKKFPNHAEVEIITEFLPSMVPLYNACDIVYSVTHAECFWLPGLEGMATGNMIIAPNWGGQLEYMNKDNSLLIEGKEGRAPREMQYWTQSPYAATFIPDLDDAAAKLHQAVNNYDELMTKFKPGMQAQLTRLTWDNVASQIVSMVNDNK